MPPQPPLKVALVARMLWSKGIDVAVEAVRLARRRVVIAVPYEDEPEELWGHVRTLTREDLAAYGLRTGLPFAVEEHHGGWLVLDLA